MYYNYHFFVFKSKTSIECIKFLLLDTIDNLVTFFFLYSGLITIFYEPYLLFIEVASINNKFVL